MEQMFLERVGALSKTIRVRVLGSLTCRGNGATDHAPAEDLLQSVLDGVWSRSARPADDAAVVRQIGLPRPDRARYVPGMGQLYELGPTLWDSAASWKTDKGEDHATTHRENRPDDVPDRGSRWHLAVTQGR